MIKIVALAAAGYTILTTGLAAYYANQAFAFSALLGGLAVIINIVGLTYSWRLIFMKKSIALAVLVIIFKYLLLGMVLLSLVKFKWLSPAGFCLGLGSLLAGIFAAAVVNSLNQRKN